MELKDDSPMPWGKHKGTKMANVPASYLLWCYTNGKCSYDVSDYVQENYDALNEEVNNKDK